MLTDCIINMSSVIFVENNSGVSVNIKCHAFYKNLLETRSNKFLKEFII